MTQDKPCSQHAVAGLVALLTRMELNRHHERNEIALFFNCF